MGTSLVYRSSLVYEVVMLGLYGRHYGARYRAVADLIPAGASVLDVCCGPATLYHRYLRRRGVEYTGVDVNPRFIDRLARKGVRGRVGDVRAGALPQADYVVMQASLYHFLPEASGVVGELLKSARREVIVAEPVRNLADSRCRWLAWVGRRATNPGTGEQAHRFTEATLDCLFREYQPLVRKSFLIPGGREKVYVLAAG